MHGARIKIAIFMFNNLFTESNAVNYINGKTLQSGVGHR
jgi:hypothetical protein